MTGGKRMKDASPPIVQVLDYVAESMKSGFGRAHVLNLLISGKFIYQYCFS